MIKKPKEMIAKLKEAKLKIKALQKEQDYIFEELIHNLHIDSKYEDYIFDYVFNDFYPDKLKEIIDKETAE